MRRSQAVDVSRLRSMQRLLHSLDRVSQVVYEWARGTPFKDICALTDVMEGSIVRAMVRSDDLCFVLKVLVAA